jgi:hypothetical protein
MKVIYIRPNFSLSHIQYIIVENEIELPNILNEWLIDPNDIELGNKIGEGNNCTN